MGLLIAGLVLFLGIHFVPVFAGMRNHVVAALGDKRYKAGFSIISGLGLILIVVGYAYAPSAPRVFDPFPFAIRLAPLVMLISFVLLAAANMKTHIRHKLRHPMLIGVGLWAAVHLLANGELKATLLFGAFLAYAAIDLLSAASRHAVKSFTPVIRQDMMAVVGGVVLALAVMAFHRQLFGVATVPWGV
ncbi:NnrU family protein [Noviherbaspirillum saxi]|uniref:NnrU family protein n=1 Tax=Noviherbaspirillum saxi TaxID=2320863 RepID=A0A3A3FS25_9BURK|nr:NnrU family protein [Noviherbaspirillum saxi]RJF97268.1 NnrU family protein [Noviherbaspirillum saxi]